MHSRLAGIKYMKPRPEDVIVLVDGDDRLYNDLVLSKLNLIYSNEPILLTFGNYINGSLDGKLVGNGSKCHSQNHYDYITKNNTFRENWAYSHLKTLKFKLLKYIKDSDLKKNGEYIRSSTDVALMVPLLELVSDKFACINDITYIYTVNHPLSLMNNSKSLQKQTNNRKYIENLPKYSKIF